MASNFSPASHFGDFIRGLVESGRTPQSEQSTYDHRLDPDEHRGLGAPNGSDRRSRVEADFDAENGRSFDMDIA